MVTHVVATAQTAGRIAHRIDAVLAADVEKGCQGRSALRLERGNVDGIEVRASVEAQEFAAYMPVSGRR